MLPCFSSLAIMSAVSAQGNIGAAELAYVPRGRWGWRLSRRYLIVALVCALAIVAWRWADDVARVTATAYWSRQCMGYAPPADLVVLEQDPAEIGRLMASGAGYHATRAGEADPPHAWLPPAQYAHIPQSGWAPRVAFMHGLRSPNGTERLVVIEFLPMREPKRPGHTVLFHPRVFSASMLSAGRQVSRNEQTVRVTMAPGERLRLYAGRADAGDRARFTIDCVIAGQRGTIEGRLRDDDVVTFRPLSGEALKQRWRAWNRDAQEHWWDDPPVTDEEGEPRRHRDTEANSSDRAGLGGEKAFQKSGNDAAELERVASPPGVALPS